MNTTVEVLGLTREAAWLPWAVQYFFLVGISAGAFFLSLPGLVWRNAAWAGVSRRALLAALVCGLTAPVATEKGKPIVQTVREEWVSGTRAGALESFKLSYEAVSQDQGAATRDVEQRRGHAGRGVAVRDAVPQAAWPISKS